MLRRSGVRQLSALVQGRAGCESFRRPSRWKGADAGFSKERLVCAAVEGGSTP